MKEWLGKKEAMTALDITPSRPLDSYLGASCPAIDGTVMAAFLRAENAP
jgi:hypothetical protein